MTRKDYVATAEILNGFKDIILDEITFADLVDEFSLMFESDNPKFSPTIFETACYKKADE